MARRTASARPSGGSAARMVKADVVSRVAASDATAQCDTSNARAPLAVPQWPNDRWSLDFVADQFIDGRRLRILVVVDDCTRECLALVPTPRSPASGSLASSIGSSLNAASPRRS